MPARSRSDLVLSVVLAPLFAAILGGCGGTGGGTGGAGGGGAGGTGGGTGGDSTTTPMIEACPLTDEIHVVAEILGPDGMKLAGDVAVTGIASGSGADTPPTFECGSGLAWVQFTEDGGDVYTACFQAPGLYWPVEPGDTIDLARTFVMPNVAPASEHTTLRRNEGELVVHVERAFFEEELTLPDGLSLARGGQVCDSPESPCKVQGFDATVALGDESAALVAGETATIGGYKLYLDRYWSESPSTGCDGGDSDILVSVSRPSP